MWVSPPPPTPKPGGAEASSSGSPQDVVPTNRQGYWLWVPKID